MEPKASHTCQVPAKIHPEVVDFISLDQVENISFEGAGFVGVSYVGVFEELSSRDGFMRRIKRVSGTSSGALAALFLALGYPPAEAREIMLNADPLSFVPHSAPSFLGDVHRVLHKYGWFTGKTIRTFVDQIVERKTGSRMTTFYDLNKMILSGKFPDMKNLYVVAANLTAMRPEVFCHENDLRHTPIAVAMRASMSIPLLYAPVRLGKALYVDGGVMLNNSVEIFDFSWSGPTLTHYEFNTRTLGFSFDERGGAFPATLKPSEDGSSPTGEKDVQISDLIQFITALVRSTTVSQSIYNVLSGNQRRMIYLDSRGYNLSSSFTLSRAQRQQLIDLNRAIVAKAFDSHKKSAGVRPLSHADIDVEVIESEPSGVARRTSPIAHADAEARFPNSSKGDMVGYLLQEQLQQEKARYKRLQNRSTVTATFLALTILYLFGMLLLSGFAS